MDINLLIKPIQSHTAEERVKAISSELFAISRPQKVRQPEASTNYLFGWMKHPNKDLAVLKADSKYVIPVHPENDLSTLQSLFPELDSMEIQQLAQYIHSNNSFKFGAIIPNGAITLSEAEMIEQGFINEIQ